MRALEKDPQLRFESCAAFVDALRGAGAQRSTVRELKVSEPRVARRKSPELQTWQECDHPLPKSRVRALAFARHSERLVAAYRDGTVLTRTIDKPQWTRWSHELSREARAAVFTPGGGFLVVADRDDLVVIDSIQGRMISKVKIPRAEIINVRPGSTGRQVCCATAQQRGKQRFVFVDLITGKTRRTLQVRAEGLTTFCLSHDGRWLVECGSNGVFVHSLRRLQLGAAPRFRIPPDCIGVQAQFSPDDRLLSIRLNNGSIQIFDVASRQSVPIEIPDQAFRWFAFSPSGQRIATVTSDRFLRCFDAFSGSQDIRHELPGTSRRIAVSDSGYIAAALDAGGLDDGGLVVSARPLLG
jgi:WD40 repeat protein